MAKAVNMSVGDMELTILYVENIESKDRGISFRMRENGHRLTVKGYRFPEFYILHFTFFKLHLLPLGWHL